MAAPTQTPRSDLHTADPNPSIRHSLPLVIIVVGVFFGLVCGAFEITNTSVGWHIASGLDVF